VVNCSTAQLSYFVSVFVCQQYSSDFKIAAHAAIALSIDANAANRATIQAFFAALQALSIEAFQAQK
jgi:hypothetical protein